MLSTTIRPPFSFPMLVSGLVAVLVGYSSSAAIVYQAAQAAGATTLQIGGWLSALGVAMGISSLFLSLRYRIPVLTAWSTPGAALLATSLHGTTLNEAIGVFVFANVLIILCGITGLFARMMAWIPQSLAAALLAGILLRFGLQTFTGLQQNIALCGAMCLTWLVCRRWMPGYAILMTLLAGIVVTLGQGNVHLSLQEVHFTLPQFIMPSFNLATLVGIGLPYFLVTMASQNAPGIATLQAYGYKPPVSSLISWTGLIALLFTPFGGYSVGIAAITAAICMSEDVDADPRRRWMAAALAGLFYLLAGLSGALIGLLFSALPPVFIQTLAGLALIATLGNSLQRAVEDVGSRDVALITFLITASGLTLFGIGSAFWGLVGGMIAHLFLTRVRP